MSGRQEVSRQESWAEVARSWVESHPPPIGAPTGSRCPRDDGERAAWERWTHDLHAAGLGCMDWPEEWGGADASLEDCLSVDRVLAASGVPIPLSDVAVSLVGPAIIRFGTLEQREAHLPPVQRGASVWTQLFSEPGAGSDLAAVRTRAKPSGRGWVVNGQKTWNTYAHIADWGFLLARTGAVEERHRGLTVFLVPMDADGITVRPIREMTGTWDYNEVFFDEVSLGPEHVLGEPGRGWQICMRLLEDERRGAGRQVMGLRAEARRLAEVLSAALHPDARVLRIRLGELVSKIEAVAVHLSGPVAEGDAERAKIGYSELNVALHDLALDVIGLLSEEVPAGWRQRWIDSALYARAYTIAGGANEVLRDVVAKRYMHLDQE